MKYKLLGRTGVQVSELCYGCMSFGGDADEAMSARMYRASRDAGINFFDTADQYNKGRSEQILGELVRGHRDELVIATKTFNPTGEDVNARGNSRRHIARAVDGSLKRLQTDRVEILYLHQQDPLTPLEESMRALEDLVRAGKVLYPALSNHSAWQTQLALGVQERAGWARLQVIQPMYNLVKRQAEVEILPMAQSLGLAVIPYSPTGGGLLTGKYNAEQKPQSARLVENKMYTARYADPTYLAIAGRFTALAAELGHHPAALAVAWAASHPGVTSVLIGGRNVEQLAPTLAANQLVLDGATRARISALSPEPPPATDRNDERTSDSYPAR
jgi:aryl-alcohol dehydrogenase-like predicted oxidoreductase